MAKFFPTFLLILCGSVFPAFARTPSITTQPADTAVGAGVRAKFSVTATGATPLSYGWMKDGTIIAGATSAAYTTPVTTTADNGALFAVIVSNSTGSVTSNNAMLTVATTPLITEQPIGEAVTAERTATFNVKAVGVTPFQYQWTRNGANIARATIHAYTTPATTQADNGAVFAVTVSNSAGSVISNAVTLTVQPAPAPTPTVTPPPVSTLRPINHLFIVMEENRSYSEIIGSGAMPYLQSLADQYGLATNYYANTHPSIGNYFMLTTGQIITNDDNYTQTVPEDNIVRHLIAAGKTWREYTESLPSVGYVGKDTSEYDQHHNPMSYFSDVRNSTAQRQNLVPLTQLMTDLAAGQLPNYGFIVPTDAHNSHDGTTLAADQWLQNNIGPLIDSPQFPQDGLLLIIFDEGHKTDTAGGGGQITWVAVGPSVKPAYVSNALYQHQNTLKTVCDLLGIGSFSSPSLATEAAPAMTEFIKPNSSPTPTVTPSPGLPVQLGNLSTRLSVGTGDNVLISGFIVTGTQSKKVILRALGPSLPVSGALSDPVLELHDGAGVLIAKNDNWHDSPKEQAIRDSGIPPNTSKESAIVMTLAPGRYTAVVAGASGTPGVALVEVYDLDQTVDSKLANISTRGFVQTDDNVMIGGMIILGNTPTKTLIRALGPSLPLAGTLTDPTLELYDGNGAVIASNDDWKDTQQSEIKATTIPPPHDAESAILQTLVPGSFTAIVRGKDNTTGIALIEVYQLGD